MPFYGRDPTESQYKNYPGNLTHIQGHPVDVLVNEQVNDYIYREAYRRSVFYGLCGNEGDRGAVIVQHKIGPGTGSVYKFKRMHPGDPKKYVVSGGPDVESVSQQLKFNTCAVGADYMGWSVYSKEIDQMEVESEVRPEIVSGVRDLSDWTKTAFDYSVLNALMYPLDKTKDFQGQSLYALDENGKMPSTSRLIINLADDANYTYKFNKDKNLQNVFATVAKEKFKKMTVKHIQEISMQINANEYNAASLVPISTTLTNGIVLEDRYIMLMSPMAGYLLKSDQDYKNLMAPSANLVEKGQASYLNNSMYLGRIENIDCYVCNYLKEYQFETAESGNGKVELCWSVVLGAGAVGRNYSLPDRRMKKDELNHWIVQAAWMWNGAKSLAFPPTEKMKEKLNPGEFKVPIEQSVFHSLTAVE